MTTYNSEATARAFKWLSGQREINEHTRRAYHNDRASGDDDAADDDAEDAAINKSGT